MAGLPNVVTESVGVQLFGFESDFDLDTGWKSVVDWFVKLKNTNWKIQINHRGPNPKLRFSGDLNNEHLNYKLLLIGYSDAWS